ncbi:MAG: hypothetical protein AB7S78_14125 [Candidatus Omnitrophota bacterium]
MALSPKLWRANENGKKGGKQDRAESVGLKRNPAAGVTALLTGTGAPRNHQTGGREAFMASKKIASDRRLPDNVPARKRE